MNADQVLYINSLIHSRLEDQIGEAKLPIKFSQDGNTNKEDMTNVLDKCNIKQKEVMHNNEKDPKKYKALQKYSYALVEVGRLLNIVPDNNDDISLEKLAQKLEGLLKSRNTIVEQINFDFYQEMYSNITDTLLEIEKCYQSGTLRASDALIKVRELKENLSQNSLSVPSILKPTQESAEYIVSQYEQAYLTEDTIKQSTADINIDKPNIKLDTEISFQELNIKTRDLTADLIVLKADFNRFVPIVNLDGLAKQMKEVNDYIQEDKWNPDKLSEMVVSIQGESTNLYDLQKKKNWEHENYAEKIQEMSELASKAAIDYKQDTVRKTVEKTDARTKEAEENTEIIEELVEGCMPEDIAISLADVVDNQLMADEENIIELAKDPEIVDIVAKCHLEENLDEQKSTLDLKNKIDELLLERSLKLEIETPDESNK